MPISQRAGGGGTAVDPGMLSAGVSSGLNATMAAKLSPRGDVLSGSIRESVLSSLCMECTWNPAARRYVVSRLHFCCMVWTDIHAFVAFSVKLCSENDSIRVPVAGFRSVRSDCNTEMG